MMTTTMTMTTGTTRTTTTEARTTAPLSARPRRSGVSVRVRITATVAALVTISLAGAGLMVYLIETQRVEEQTVREVEQELAEFTELQDKGIDPDTGNGFSELEPLLFTFLERNVPNDDELLIGWLDGEPVVWFPDLPLVGDPQLQAAIAPLVVDSGSTRLDTASGPVLVATQAIRDGDSRGAMVVVAFLEPDREAVLDTMRTYAVVALLSLLVLGAVAFWQAGRLLAPLREVRRTAETIRDTDLSQRLTERGNDDITALTRTFNSMLDRLESAFVGQRRFLDDAGHELKTPLTVLRGHLELLDAGSPEEVTETRDLLLDEVDRMSRLVGDLTLLAKSSRPDFIHPEDTDVARLTEATLAKARGLGERSWELDEAAGVRVALDEQRITQALLQLADNAVKHTGPGDVVALGSRVDGDHLLLWVRDSGPGVPVHDHERIFERFGRSRVAPGDEGFGLGLSIVSAIADAHGGSVRLDEDFHDGARFVIALPLTTRAPEGDR
jgi:two-component system, OmpR family, sensor kinase